MLAGTLAVAACSSTEPDETVPAPTVPTQSRAKFSELVTLAGEGESGAPGEWHVNDSRTTVVYELRTGAGFEVWAANNRGEPWQVAETGTVESIELAADGRIAITDKNEGTGRYRITLAQANESENRAVATSFNPMSVLGFTGDELVYSAAGDRQVDLFAWNERDGQAREVGSFGHEDSDVFAATLAGDHVVFEPAGGRRQPVAMSLVDGAVVQVPQHDPKFESRLVGVTPSGEAVFAEGRPGGGYIYTVDLANPDEMIVLALDAVVELVFMEGTSVRYGNTAGEQRLLDLATGEETAAPSLRAEPPGPVPGLEEGSVRLIEKLTNGNWIVTGWLVDGSQYRALWDFNEQFGGTTSDEPVRVKGLFEFNPQTQELWQVSGPPTSSATSTATGSGIGPNGVLRVEVLDGFVVFTTGFSGAAYDIEYNLYASPIPSLVGD